MSGNLLGSHPLFQTLSLDIDSKVSGVGETPLHFVV